MSLLLEVMVDTLVAGVVVVIIMFHQDQVELVGAEPMVVTDWQILVVVVQVVCGAHLRGLVVLV